MLSKPSTSLTAALLTCALAASASSARAADHTFSISDSSFLLDNAPFRIRCGEVHAARVPVEYWRHRLQMVKAMGLNTVCAYMFWNMHQPTPAPGEFNFSGQADIARFCKVAQEEGLWVILRPGPYACAEWEMGGFPWWLLKEDNIQLRTRDPKFLAAVKTYLTEVGKILTPLQITHGGPILMVQVENEYGFYGKDSQYMGDLRQMLLDAGFNVPLFACNPTAHLRDGYRSDLFPVVNFGSDPAGAFKELRKVLPKGPLMCGEFYPGWFDTWGAPHHLGNAQRYLTDLEYMLKNDDSFSIYMAHGGSSFGLWSGADQPFKPDTSSYDYDAPISEAGWITPRFTQTRDLITKYLAPGEKLPDPPAKNPVMSFPPVTATAFTGLLDHLPAPIADDTPHTMEHYNEGYGAILYRTTLPAGPAGTLDAADVHDFGHVFLDGKEFGIMDRRSHLSKVQLPVRGKSATLDILVETQGRVNFGSQVVDRKGLYAPVHFTAHGANVTEIFQNWQIFPLPLNGNPPAVAPSTDNFVTGPAYYHFSVNIPKPADTFLDMRNWGKGIVWVNDHCLGRFWNIGPTQTMYLPGPWLHPGKNEITVLDFLGSKNPTIAGLDHPILDELHPELDFSHKSRAEVTLHLDTTKPILAAAFPAGADTQDVKLPTPTTGRYFALQSLDAQDNKPFTAIAELDLLDASGKPLNHEGWTIAYVDSEERTREDGSAENAIDGQTSNFWHTQWSAGDGKPEEQPKLPHTLILDLGTSQPIAAFRYTPRQGGRNTTGRIKNYRVYISDTLIEKK